MIDINELEKEYFEKFIGKTVEVLIEEQKEDGFYHGFTSNYIPLKLKGNYKINELYDNFIILSELNYFKYKV